MSADIQESSFTNYTDHTRVEIFRQIILFVVYLLVHKGKKMQNYSPNATLSVYKSATCFGPI
jgi:hypothetical protein